MIITFKNVSISLEAASPEDAYDILTNNLSNLVVAYDAEYTTDTYTVGDDAEEHSTEKLFGK
jgi:hypothetical protein